MATTTSVRALRSGLSLAAVLLAIGTAGVAHAQAARGAIPDRLSDAEFWRLFTTMSEASGTFPSENFTSNEQSFTSVLPTLVRTATTGGVYLGVGPEQNFTYIAHLKPSMAIILDIRRQNAMVHLLYKALFELSPTRRDFVGRLFARTLPSSIPVDAPVTALIDAALATASTLSSTAATRDEVLGQLTVIHGFPLSPDDRRTIETVQRAFAFGGPHINFDYDHAAGLPAWPTGSYPTFASIQLAMNPDGARLTFLASEALYQQVRDLQRRNLIIPVVGDFAGPKALRAIGDYLTSQRATVSAFYVSNVEEYLLPPSGGASAHGSGFYRNLSTLPLDGSSMFIRSSRPSYLPAMAAPRVQPGMAFARTRFDSGGIRWTRVVTRPDAQDVITITTSADSALVPGRASPRRPVVETMPATRSSALTFSGLASIQATVSASTLTNPFTYRDVLALTQFVPR